MARVADLQVAGVALAADVDRAEVGGAGGAEVVDPLERLGGGAQHRPHQVGPGARGGEDVGDEDALRDLGSLLLAQLALALDGHLGGGGDQSRVALGGGVEQLIVAEGLRHPVGELVVDLIDVIPKEGVPGLVGPLGDSRGKSQTT